MRKRLPLIRMLGTPAIASYGNMEGGANNLNQFMEWTDTKISMKQAVLSRKARSSPHSTTTHAGGKMPKL